jgi:Cd2+/Zn2+-exporting ATPase
MATQAKPVCARCELHAEAVFRVEGMDCHEEVVILERRLKPLAGLESMSADVIGQRLHVQYDAAKLTTADMVDAVGQTGMRIWLEHEEPRASAPDVRARFSLTVASGLALAAGIAANAYGLAPASALSFGIGAPCRGISGTRAVTALRTRTGSTC